MKRETKLYPQKCRRESCGYQWDSKVEYPKECPECKARQKKKGGGGK